MFHTYVCLIIICLYKYVDMPSCCDPNTVFGRTENRYKRELEQWLYENVYMRFLSAGAYIILGAIVLVVFCFLYILGIR